MGQCKKSCYAAQADKLSYYFLYSYTLLIHETCFRNKTVLRSVAASHECRQTSLYRVSDVDSSLRRDHRGEPAGRRWERGAGHVSGGTVSGTRELGGEGRDGGS